MRNSKGKTERVKFASSLRTWNADNVAVKQCKVALNNCYYNLRKLGLKECVTVEGVRVMTNT